MSTQPRIQAPGLASTGHPSNERNILSYRLRGQKLMPEGWRAAFVGVKGDAAARAAMNMFARHCGATYICDGRLATQGFPDAPRPLLFPDFSGQALCHHAGAKPSAWRRVPGWRGELSYRDSTGV